MEAAGAVVGLDLDGADDASADGLDDLDGDDDAFGEVGAGLVACVADVGAVAAFDNTDEFGDDVEGLGRHSGSRWVRDLENHSAAGVGLEVGEGWERGTGWKPVPPEFNRLETCSTVMESGTLYSRVSGGEALHSRLELAIEAAREAGAITLRYFRSAGFSTEQKGDGSPVTTADREAEAAIRSLIQGRFADDAILGEEHGETPGTSGFRWILDPIDGTISFVHGVPLFGTLIGVERVGQAGGATRAEIGVIHMPVLGETVYAASGLGAWYLVNGERRPARVSSTGSLANALVCTTSHEYWKRKGREDLLLPLSRACLRTRGWSDCYAHLLVATGRADAVVEPGVHPWDVAATIPIIREAGGRCTDWRGVETSHGGNNIASNGRIHEELVRTLADGRGA